MLATGLASGEGSQAVASSLGTGARARFSQAGNQVGHQKDQASNAVGKQANQLASQLRRQQGGRFRSVVPVGVHSEFVGSDGRGSRGVAGANLPPAAGRNRSLAATPARLGTRSFPPLFCSGGPFASQTCAHRFAAAAMAGHAEAVDANASGGSTPQEVLVATAEAARPRPFKFPVASTALVVLKMQREFLEVGGYGSLLGNDVGVLRQCIPSVAKLLAAVREAGVARGMRVVHVRESHQADMSDVHTSKLRRTRQQSKGITIGDRGLLGRVLIEGEPGNDFIPECKPLPSEMVCATAGKGIFNGTGLHQLLLEAGVTHVVLAGVTTDVGVQLVMRELNDRGFEPCLAADCTASYLPMLKDVSLDMIVAQGGIVGWTAESADLIAGLRSATAELWDPRPDWVPPSVPTLLPLSGAAAAAAPSPTPAAAAALMADGGDGAGGGDVDSASRGVATVQDAAPSPFSFPVDRTACLVIDMQRDFVMEGGFGSTLGNDVKRLQAIVPNVAFLQRVCREYGIPVMHTLEAHLPDLSDCPLAKLTRGQLPSGLRIGDKGAMGRILVRHEWGNGIVDENAPLPGEKVIFKPGKGAFCNTDLHDHLLALGITHLLVAGVTTEVCVQTSLREANDRGFECIMIDDCTESYFPHFKHATLAMVAAQGGILGWTGTSAGVLKALQQCCGPSAGASS